MKACCKIILFTLACTAPTHADIVTDWNDAALNAIRATGTPPPKASRALAMAHLAVYDAVNSISINHEAYLGYQPLSGPTSMQAAAAPSDPAWQQRWEQAVQAMGLTPYRLPSGAGHDAMKLHTIMPQAMLFVRGLNAGISHNPLESITNHDAELAVIACQNLLFQIATELS